MAEKKTTSKAAKAKDASRRDFLAMTAASFGAVGAGSVAWPFINSMNPAKDTLALSSTEVDISSVEVGQSITVMWRGKPVFIRHRTAKEIEEAKDVDVAKLRDPQADKERVQKAEWLVLVGICTHLGCVPGGQKSGEAAAITMDGSAHATDHTMIHLAVFAKAPRLKTWPCLRMHLPVIH